MSLYGIFLYVSPLSQLRRDATGRLAWWGGGGEKEKLGTHFRDELVVVGEVCTAVDAGIRSVAMGQIRLERFHHGGTGTAIQTAGRLRLEIPHKYVKIPL